MTEDPTYTKPPSNGGCPMAAPGEDWLEFGDSCYLFKAEQKNFADSRMECHYRLEKEMEKDESVMRAEREKRGKETREKERQGAERVRRSGDQLCFVS